MAQSPSFNLTLARIDSLNFWILKVGLISIYDVHEPVGSHFPVPAELQRRVHGRLDTMCLRDLMVGSDYCIRNQFRVGVYCSAGRAPIKYKSCACPQQVAR